MSRKRKQQQDPPQVQAPGDTTSQFHGAPERYAPPPKKKTTAGLAAAGMVVVAAMAVGGYALLNSDPADNGPAATDEQAAQQAPEWTSAYEFGTRTQCRYLTNKRPDKPATDAAECGVDGVRYDISTFENNADRDEYLAQAGPIAKAYGMEYDLLVGDRFIISPTDTSDIGDADYDVFSDVYGGDVEYIG